MLSAMTISVNNPLVLQGQDFAHIQTKSNPATYGEADLHHQCAQ
jgi:hypothetical protein